MALDDIQSPLYNMAGLGAAGCERQLEDLDHLRDL
jgi:hypothetical protein